MPRKERMKRNLEGERNYTPICRPCSKNYQKKNKKSFGMNQITRVLKRRVASTSTPSSITIHSVTVAKIAKNTISIPITVKTQSGESIKNLAMIDSGAGGKFIDQNVAKKFEVKKLDTPIHVYNVDGTKNKKGTIKYFVDLEF